MYSEIYQIYKVISPISGNPSGLLAVARQREVLRMTGTVTIDEAVGEVKDLVRHTASLLYRVKETDPFGSVSLFYAGPVTELP